MEMYQAIKSKYLKFSLLCVFFCAMVLTLPACSAKKSETSQAPKPSAVYGKGDTFYAKDYDFTLDEIVLTPEYDTDTHTGYGVVFLKKAASAPVTFSANSLSGGTVNPVSLVDMTLTDAEQTVGSENIMFASLDDNTSYKGSVTFVFRINNDSPFPMRGSFVYKESDQNSQIFEIDLTGLVIPEAIKKELPAGSSAVEAADDEKDETDSEPLSFSEPQEYEGEIPFENSKNVRICFYLSADAKKITQIVFSMDDLYLTPKDENSRISNTNITDASMTHTGGFDVIDGNVSSNSFFIFDLMVVDSCIYGMINIEMEQEDVIMVNEPVYIVIPNITTPRDIPTDVSQP